MEFTMSLFNGIMDVLNTALNFVFSFLPVSPFISILGDITEIPFVGYLCYFFPIGKMLSATLIWLSAIAVFYLYQIVLRWIKAIDD